jgi:2-amino-4-hydroxy-6-hydroxymethyldihydropteridine diphosphokinase
LELFARLQAIEKSICADSHRNADGSYRDRLIDIDLIFYGQTHISIPQLTLPHPHAAERTFVLGPIRELHPEASPDIYFRDSGIKEVDS